MPTVTRKRKPSPDVENDDVSASVGTRMRAEDPIAEEYKKDMESLRQQAVEKLNEQFETAMKQASKRKKSENDEAYWLTAFFANQLRRIHKIYPAKEPDHFRKVMSMGVEDTNSCGLINDPNDVKKFFYPPTVIRKLHGNKIVAVAAGGQTSAALTDEGSVYTWGVNDNFALGRKVEENEEHLVKKMEAPAATDSEARNRLDPGFMRNVMQVRMGDSHTLVLTIDGKVYSTGIYKDDSRKWRDLSSAQHQVWLNFNNKSKEEQAANIDVVTRNEYDGPLGTNQAPTPVDLVPGKVVWIECGPSWNAVQLEDGTLWTWGLGVSGQLARSKSMGAKLKGGGPSGPASPPIGEHEHELLEAEVVDPNTGNVNNTGTNFKAYELRPNFQRYYVDENGKEHFDESNILNNVLKTFLTPGPVEWAGPSQKREVLQFGCGELHFVVVARDYGAFSTRVYSSGGNNYGQLGHGDLFERHELTPIRSLDNERISMAACGQFHTLALALDGSTVFSWGRSDSGQLGLYKMQQEAGACKSDPQEVPFPEDTMKESRVVDIACGETISFAITSVGSLYSWGFNESGATGHPSVDKIDIHLPYMVHLHNTHVEAVYGGSQHALMLVKRY